MEGVIVANCVHDYNYTAAGSFQVYASTVRYICMHATIYDHGNVKLV